MYTSRIAGMGKYVPDNVVTNDDLAAKMDTNDAWIQERTGIQERHHIEKDDDNTTATMGVKAAKIAVIKKEVEAATGHRFNICLVNLYRDGQDSNGWHADNERGLGRNPVIASISLGQERFFHLRHNENKKWRYKFPLKNGSLLLMAGQTQHNYKHQIAKTKRQIQPRINLTFRKVVDSSL